MSLDLRSQGLMIKYVPELITKIEASFRKKNLGIHKIMLGYKTFLKS